LFGSEIVGLVGDVVNETHKSVERGQTVATSFWQEKKRVVEIAVRRTRYAMALFVGLRDEVIGGLSVRSGRRLRIFCHEMRDERAAEQARLLRFADRGAMVQGVVAGGFDGVENGDAAAAEHFEIDTQAGVDHFGQRHALGEECARADNQILHQVDVPIVEAVLDDVGLGQAVRGGGIERNVDAALFEVPSDVLPEIGELQCSASGVGKALALVVTIAAQIEDEAPDRIGGIEAIIQHRIPSGTALYGLILAKGLEQIGKRLPGNILGDDGFAQRDEDGMRRLPFVTIV
jgi:hypothetical protein